MSGGQGAKDPEGAIGLENDFRCGTVEGAKGRALNKVPVWRYLFANNKPNTTDGATHGVEVPFIFGDGKAALSKFFQDTWVAFARDPAEALSKLGWPKYDAQGKFCHDFGDCGLIPVGNTLVRIAKDQKPGVDFVQANMYDGTCGPLRV
jgi:cholinesterase